jgi:glycerol uptake facilitator-like aquaporin
LAGLVLEAEVRITLPSTHHITSPLALRRVPLTATSLGLTLIHLISIPVTNTSVNPARSTATAVFVGGWALQQLWLFWLAPIVGATIAGVTSKVLFEVEPPMTGRTRS